MTDYCSHPECNQIADVAEQLFSGGATLAAADLSQDLPGNRRFAVQCARRPRAGFQVQDTTTGKWYQLDMWEIANPDTIEALESHMYRERMAAAAPPETEEQPVEVEVQS